MIREPETVEEWQEAVNLAYGSLAFELARLYGFTRGGPVLVVDRAEQILERGKERGITPGPEAIRLWLAQLEFDEAEAERLVKIATLTVRYHGGDALAGVRFMLAFAG